MNKKNKRKYPKLNSKKIIKKRNYDEMQKESKKLYPKDENSIEFFKSNNKKLKKDNITLLEDEEKEKNITSNEKEFKIKYYKLSIAIYNLLKRSEKTDDNTMCLNYQNN